ncbi:MAG: hypothetical protein AAF721_31125 [Myxococcota bacterium]
MASSKGIRTAALCAAFVLAACGDDSSPAAGTEGTGSSTTGDDTTGPVAADSTGVAVCDESMEDFEPGVLPADVVINIGSSLLTPHPVLQAAIVDVAATYEGNDVRVALIASGEYEQPYATEVCNDCGLGDECADPIGVNANPGVIEPLARFAGSTGSYSCLFRPPGESVRHYVTFTDTEPGPGELMDFEGFLIAAGGEADSVFHVAYMLGCSQMEGGMGLAPLAEASGGSSGNICDGVAGVREFLEGIAVPRVACGFPVADPGPNNSSDNLELLLLDTPSGGEMAMTRVADGLCTETSGDDALEWFVSSIDGVDFVRLCPTSCSSLQEAWAPGEVAFRQQFTCPAE